MMEVDEILRPLMDLMDGSLSLFAQTCEKPVLKRILRELWKLVIRILERSVVLPPMMDKTVSHIYSLARLSLTRNRITRYLDDLEEPQ